MEPTLIFYSDSELLEGPVFDKQNNLLYFVSILENLVFCYSPKTKEILTINLDSPVGCIFVDGDKKVIAASKNGFFEIDFNLLQKKFLFQIEIGKDVRYNDGIKDSKGRLIIGTMGFPTVKENRGKVFSYYHGKYQVIIENTTISNGLAFSADEKLLYFIDTPTKKVAKYSYEINTGKVQFEEYVITFDGNSSPDGMCIDEDGMLWISEWGGARISKWNPKDGKKLNEVKLPCTNVTSCCFDDLGNLYVTSAKSDNENEICAGGLFYVQLNKSN